MTVLRGLAQLTPQWLTERLRLRRRLTAAESVAEIRIRETIETAGSRLCFFSAEPEEGAFSLVPQRLVAKLPKTVPAPCSEAAFYEIAAPLRDALPIADCIDAESCIHSGAYHVILEDISATHVRPDLDLPPTQRQSELMIDSLALLHGAFWDHASDSGASKAAASLRLVASAAAHYPAFRQMMDDRLSPARRDAIEQALHRLPEALSQRLAAGRNLTLVHGDAHAWNFLVPREASGRAVLVDWHIDDGLTRIAPGPGDLASLIVNWWFPDRRSRLELPLLKRYFQRLCDLGVSGYLWEECLVDYRLFAALALLRPIQDSIAGVPWNWFPQLEKALQAHDDLNCQGVYDDVLRLFHRQSYP